MLLGILGILSLIVIYLIMVMIKDSNRFAVSTYTFSDKRIKKDYTFVMLSDLHNKIYGKDNDSLIEAIDAASPDSIILAGDMLTAKPGLDFSAAVSLINRLAKKYQVYYANGNHEYRVKLYHKTYGNMYKRYASAVRKDGVVMLINQSIQLKKAGIRITGLELNRKYFKRLKRTHMNEEYLKSVIGEPNNDAFQILIAHNPDYFKNYAAWGADLTLSGHIHGGVVNVPLLGGLLSPQMQIFPKYDAGLFEENGKKMILSRGLGMHTIPVRLWNPGELVIVHLKQKS